MSWSTSTSPNSDETGDKGEEGATSRGRTSGDEGLGEETGDEEVDGSCSCAKESEIESAGEKGGGDEGGNGEDGVNNSSTSILLSLSLVNGGRGSIEPRAGDVGTEGKRRCGNVTSGNGAGEDVTSGTGDADC